MPKLNDVRKWLRINFQYGSIGHWYAMHFARGIAIAVCFIAFSYALFVSAIYVYEVKVAETVRSVTCEMIKPEYLKEPCK